MAQTPAHLLVRRPELGGAHLLAITSLPERAGPQQGHDPARAGHRALVGLSFVEESRERGLNLSTRTAPTPEPVWHPGVSGAEPGLGTLAAVQSLGPEATGATMPSLGDAAPSGGT